jgi:formylglycine-generating enzyme required for sulfatase activity
MLAMALPYRAATAEELYANIVNAAPDFSLLEACQVPDPVIALLARCLAKDPVQRPASFAEIEAGLLPFGPHSLREEQHALRSITRPATINAALSAALPTIQTPPPEIAPPEVLPAEAPAPEPAPARPAGRQRWLLAASLAFLAIGAGLTSWILLRPKELPARIRAKGGDMVLIPAGPALIGENRRPAEVAAFYLDVSEVSNGSYLEFCAETRHPCPASAQASAPGAPAIDVTLADAQAFARWAGKRLPTAVEWEKAVRGPAGRLFPWGNDWAPGAANLPASRAEAGKLKPELPGRFLRFASPEGAVHLIGNVWEWTSTPGRLLPEGVRSLSQLPQVRSLNPPLTLTDQAAQVCGGSFQLFYDQETRQRLSWDYLALPARLALPDVGFRCARDAVR